MGLNASLKLVEVATELVNAMDKTADKCLPEEIAGVVKLHSKLAVGTGWIPVPGVNVAASAANIWGMYVRINDKLGIPFAKNILKSIGAGVATNLGGYFTAIGIGTAMKFIPGIGTIASGVIMSAAIYALTLTSGYIYLKALCLLAQKKGTEFNAKDVEDAINDTLKDKSAIKDYINSAKKVYKECKDLDSEGKE